MNALVLLYALTLTMELVLSLLMAIFLFLIVAPRPGRAERERATPPTASAAASQAALAATPLADPTVAAVRRALETIARGENDVQTLIQTRRALQLAERTARGRTPR